MIMMRQKRNTAKTPVTLAPGLAVSGTPFQIQVWRELLTIPKGETVTYQALADRVGAPRAVRAVANAVGANPIPIRIPCHRVVRSDGTLGGYSGPGGAEQKRVLLEQEGVVVKDSKISLN
jgi:methylated-DNA-[protein]-cysteine S-methyltransferase